jgi:NAD(P)H-hydrate epimerase
MNTYWSDPVLTCADAKTLEARLFGGDEESEWAAMQRAGAAVAQAALDDFKEIGGFPDAGGLLVLVGKGHNGGDALLAAEAILGFHPAATADVVFVFGERTLRPLASRAWRRLTDAARQRVRMIAVAEIASERPGSVAVSASERPGPVAASVSERSGPVAASVSEWPRYDLCLDGVFGFQFHPPVDAATAAVLRAVNAHPAIRLRAAVDLPSGVGEQSGEIAFQADFTYATGSVKAPLLEECDRGVAGRLRYCDLGFFDRPHVGSSLASDSFDPSRASALPARCADPGQLAINFVLKPSILSPLGCLRAPLSDKRTYGHLFVVAGSRSYPGAALMCVRSALRSGVGLVTAFVPESLVPAFATCAPEAIWVGWPETPDGGLALEGLHLLRTRLERATAFVIGPGLGTEPETHTLAEEIVKMAGVPVVLDADALQPSILAAAKGKRVICLPHAGEFKRLAGGLGGTGCLPVSGAGKNIGETGVRPEAMTGGLPVHRTADALESGPDALCAVARETGAVIVLKGSVTRISDGDRIYHSLFGGPVLARGGSGDLLAGLTGGLLAQAPDDPQLAANRGVVWHGLAADHLARDRGQVAVQVTQLLDYLPAALRESAR